MGSSKTPARRPLAIEHGFLAVLVAILVFFSVATPHFASIPNAAGMLHTMAPLVVMSCGLGFVVLSSRLDISIGSVAFLSSTAAIILMKDYDTSPVLAFAVALACGAALGALNGFIVVVLGINSLIATLGTMIAFRGVALEVTKAVLIPLPEPVRALGNLAFGPVFADVIVAAAVLVVVDTLHRRTVFGRQVNAIGNGSEIAARIGVPVNRLVFLSFVLSGFLASLGGLMSLIQVGAISGYLGKGVEFTAVAVIVVGGISLFGGRGNLIPGVFLGALTFTMIENGLNQMSANPYLYRLATGVIIFAAMYVDALKSGRLGTRRVALASTEEEPPGAVPAASHQQS